MLQLPIFAYVVAAAVLLASGFGAGWKAQGNIADAKISRMNVAAAKKDSDAKDDLLRAQETARLAEQALSTKFQGALDEATKRETRLRTELDGVRRTAGGLRDTLYAIRRDAPNYSQPAAAATTGTLAELFEQCSAALVDLGEKADRHASDSLMLLEAWPKPPDKRP